MAVTSCVITGTLPLDSTPVSFTRSGFGTPEAAIVFMGRAHSSANPTTSAGLSIGFWDGTNQYASSVFIEDNLSAATLTSRHRYANRIAGERYWDGAAYQNLCQYTIASTTDGVTFTLTDDNTGASRYATVILFKGLTSVKLGNFAFAGSTSAIDVTNVGFKPDVVFYVNPVAADAYTTNTVDNQGCIIAFGVAHNNSADTITQHCVSFWSGNNAANTLVNTSTNDNCIGRRWTDDTTSFTEIISAFDANGFTVTPGAASSSRPFYLAMKLDDPDDAYVGIVDSKTSTGTQAYTGTGFVPKVLILASTTETAVNQSSTSPSGALMLGATDGTEQQALVIMDDDAAATSDANSRADTGNVLNLRFDNDTVDAVAAYSSFDSDGFTLNYSDGSASARKILAFALGDSAGGGATITGDSGSYTLTGTAATLKVGRKLTADSGTYSLTGTDVAFKRGYALSAESGTYTVSGTAVDLKAGRKLTADSGSYTLTGTDVTLNYSPAGSYNLTAESGTYTLTGTAATLKVSRKLTADSGTYALTGTAAGLAKGVRLTAESGSYTLTGSNVAFARTYVLTAESGAYTLTGTSAGLTWSGAPVVEVPTNGGPSIYGKPVFREKQFRKEYEEQVKRIEDEKRLARILREDEEITVIMALMAA